MRAATLSSAELRRLDSWAPGEILALEGFGVVCSNCRIRLTLAAARVLIEMRFDVDGVATCLCRDERACRSRRWRAQPTASILSV